MHSGREKFATEIIRVLEPGAYAPHRCGAWNFLPDSEALLETFSSTLLEHAAGELLTSHHLSIPVCLLAFNDTILINPSLAEELSHPRTLRTRFPDLCNASAPVFEASFAEHIVLEWQDAEAAWHRAALEGADALRLQKALYVLSGSDVCDSQRIVT